MTIMQYIDRYLKSDGVRLITPKQLKALHQLEKECKKISPDVYFELDELSDISAFGPMPLKVYIWLPEANYIRFLWNDVVDYSRDNPCFKLEISPNFVNLELKRNTRYPANNTQEKIIKLIEKFAQEQGKKIQINE